MFSMFPYAYSNVVICSMFRNVQLVFVVSPYKLCSKLVFFLNIQMKAFEGMVMVVKFVIIFETIYFFKKFKF